MSAREALYMALWDNYTPVEKNRLIGAFTRELAEKQRGFADQEDAHLTTVGASYYVQGVRDAADLIDPEVST